MNKCEPTLTEQDILDKPNEPKKVANVTPKDTDPCWELPQPVIDPLGSPTQ